MCPLSSGEINHELKVNVPASQQHFLGIDGVIQIIFQAFAVSFIAGLMFWFTLKKLFVSYLVFLPTRRS